MQHRASTTMEIDHGLFESSLDDFLHLQPSTSTSLTFDDFLVSDPQDPHRFPSDNLGAASLGRQRASTLDFGDGRGDADLILNGGWAGQGMYGGSGHGFQTNELGDGMMHQTDFDTMMTLFGPPTTSMTFPSLSVNHAPLPSFHMNHSTSHHTESVPSNQHSPTLTHADLLDPINSQNHLLSPSSNDPLLRSNQQGSGPAPGDMELLREAQQRIFQLQVQLQQQQAPLTQPNSLLQDGQDSKPLPAAAASKSSSVNAEPGVTIPTKRRKMNQEDHGGGGGGTKKFSLKPAYVAAIKGLSASSKSSSSNINSTRLILNAGLPEVMTTRGVVNDTLPASQSSNKVPIAPLPSPTGTASIAPKFDFGIDETVGDRSQCSSEARKVKSSTKSAVAALPTEPSGHNAVEKRYRENINGHIASLRSLIPALAHLRDSGASTNLASIVTEDDLIDGIPAAQKLSKGIILGKAVEYIRAQRLQRQHLQEDVNDLKGLVKKMVQGGQAIVAVFENGRKKKCASRLEQFKRLAELGTEVFEEPKSSTLINLNNVKLEPSTSVNFKKNSNQQTQTPAGGARRRHSNAGDSDSSGSSPSSTTSSVIQASTVTTAASPSSINASPRSLYAAFLGVTFAGGMGYDYISQSSFASKHGVHDTSSRAWLIPRSMKPLVSALPRPTTLIRSTSTASTNLVTSGFACIGLFSVIGMIMYIVVPWFASFLTPNQATLMKRRRAKMVAMKTIERRLELQSMKMEEMLDVYVALKVLSRSPTTLFRTLFGVLAQVGLAFIVVLLKGNRFEVEEDVAAACIRMAEVECSQAKIARLSKWYTWLRLFNLSRSKNWPVQQDSAGRAKVDAILAVHLLHQQSNVGLTRRVASSLWERARRCAKKEAVVDVWTSLALSTEFDEVCNIIDSSQSSGESAVTLGGTLPMLLVAERRFEAALVDTWAKIFVAVIRATCPISSDRSSTLSFEAFNERDGLNDLTWLAKAAAKASQQDVSADEVELSLPLISAAMEEIYQHTIPGTRIHSLASITIGLWSAGFGNSMTSKQMVTKLSLEVKCGGITKQMSTAKCFIELMRVVGSNWVEEFETTPNVLQSEQLCLATLQWLIIHQRYQHFIKTSNQSTKTQKKKKVVDEQLHQSTLSLRRLLATSTFRDLNTTTSTTTNLLEASVGETSESRSERGLERELDLIDVVHLCVDSLTDIGRRACGKVTDDDSACDLSD